MALSPDFLATMPKVELHVHLEGSIRPETVLALAKRNNVALPADSIEGLRSWYEFRDFAHFVEVYVAITKYIQSADDLEFIAREFLQGQADQNILYTEATFTACTIEKYCGIPVNDQIEAINRAIAWAKETLNVDMQLILDIVRGDPPERAMQVVEWVAEWLGKGVCALGLAGFENRGTVMYKEQFAEAQRLGLPVAAHAGETQGAWSIEETLEITGAKRIGHGVRALESPRLIETLKADGITLEVCPTSNVCLGGFPSLAEHPIQQLLDEGIAVTLNSDDPPMFNTSLTQEWIRCSETFGWNHETANKLFENAVRAAFLPSQRKDDLRQRATVTNSLR